MSDIKSESPHVLGKGSQHVGVGRRPLLRAGLVATPVVLAVSGRSAMAAVCPTGLSPLTMASLDPNHTGECAASSHHVFTNTLGLSPGYWKPNCNGQTFQPPHPWPISPFHLIKTTDNKTYVWNRGNYLDYKNIAKDAAGWATGTKYNNIFTSSFSSRSFSRILLDDNGSLEWHFCAAYLNAATMPGTYAMTVQEVLDVASTGCLVPGGSMLTDGQMKAFLSQTWA